MLDFTLLSSKKLPFWEILLILFLFALYLVPSFSMGSTMLLLLLLAYCVYIVLIDSEMFSPVVVPLVLIMLLKLMVSLINYMPNLRIRELVVK